MSDYYLAVIVTALCALSRALFWVVQFNRRWSHLGNSEGYRDLKNHECDQRDKSRN